MSSDFSNQSIVADDASDRMVLSQFGYDGSDEGFGSPLASIARKMAMSPVRLAQMQARAAQKIAGRKMPQKALQNAKMAALARHAMKRGRFPFGGDGLVDISRPNPHCHPMEGFEGLFDDLKRTVTKGFTSTYDRLIGTAKTEAAKQVSQVASTIAADPKVQQTVQAQVKQQPADAVAQKLVSAGESVAAGTKAVAEAVKTNKLPLSVLLGGALAAYFLFFRR
jgi:hypothetical protein